MGNWDRNNINTIRAILNNIIANNGSCDGFMITRWCVVCPFANTKMRSDGSFFSCTEVLIGDPVKLLSAEEMDQVFKKEAEQLLANIEIEEVLLNDN